MLFYLQYLTNFPQFFICENVFSQVERLQFGYKYDKLVVKLNKNIGKSMFKLP